MIHIFRQYEILRQLDDTRAEICILLSTLVHCLCLLRNAQDEAVKLPRNRQRIFLRCDSTVERTGYAITSAHMLCHKIDALLFAAHCAPKEASTTSQLPSYMIYVTVSRCRVPHPGTLTKEATYRRMTDPTDLLLLHLHCMRSIKCSSSKHRG
jgi:hypothetical protein